MCKIKDHNISLQEAKDSEIEYFELQALEKHQNTRSCICSNCSESRMDHDREVERVDTTFEDSLFSRAGDYLR